MSPSKEKDLLPLLVILESISKIKIYVRPFQSADLFFQDDDQAKFNASLLLLINISEQSKKLSQELYAAYPDIPIRLMRSLRNRIAHDYTGIDYEMIFDIVKNDIVELEWSVISMLKSELRKGTFDDGELEAARNSPFYKHIHFEDLI